VRGRIQGLSNFLSTPYYLRNGKSYADFKFGQYVSEGPSEQKPIKNFGEKGAWVGVSIPGTAQFFSGRLYSLLSQERVKLRTSNFARTFIGSIGTKAH